MGNKHATNKKRLSSTGARRPANHLGAALLPRPDRETATQRPGPVFHGVQAQAPDATFHGAEIKPPSVVGDAEHNLALAFDHFDRNPRWRTVPNRVAHRLLRDPEEMIGPDRVLKAQVLGPNKEALDLPATMDPRGQLPQRAVQPGRIRIDRIKLTGKAPDFPDGLLKVTIDPVGMIRRN